jgi:hypothetical protein
MLNRFATPVTHLLKNNASQPARPKGVHELLQALAEVRARKADLERQEQEIIAATRARLSEQQQELEALRRKAQDCGIEAEDQAARPGPAPVLSN